MHVKSDTKEKFHAITVLDAALSATMTEEMGQTFLAYLDREPRNLVLNMNQVQSIDLPAAEKLVTLQQRFYEHSRSFVICCLQKPVEQFLDENELLEIMNVTPTESEAWDIVQMEEIERELLD